jgi:hypothetical protein
MAFKSQQVIYGREMSLGIGIAMIVVCFIMLMGVMATGQPGQMNVVTGKVYADTWRPIILTFLIGIG